MFETLPLSPLQKILLWPGGKFMDWLAYTCPEIVIRYGFGFTTESYVFWSGVISLGFWLILLFTVTGAMRRLRGR